MRRGSAILPRLMEAILSRTEELKRKFREKGRLAVAEVTSPRGRFAAALHEFTQRTYGASSADEAFTAAMFERFEADAPGDLKAWLVSATNGLFRCTSERPAWVGEVDWCFHDGVPLEFLAQFADDRGVTYYVFRGLGADKRAFFKMRAWDGDDRIVLSGAIEG